MPLAVSSPAAAGAPLNSAADCGEEEVNEEHEAEEIKVEEEVEVEEEEEEEKKVMEESSKLEAPIVKEAGQENDKNRLEDVKLVSSSLEQFGTSHAVSELRTQIRPRSSALGVPNNSSKKPAILCRYFAKGWCMKGNSCTFLHQKEVSANVGERSKGGVGNPIQTGHMEDRGGKPGGTEASNKSTVQSPRGTSNALWSENSGIHVPGDSVPFYGGNAYALPKVNDQSNHGSDISLKIPFKGNLSNLNYIRYDKRMEPFSSEEHERKSGVRDYPGPAFSGGRLSDGQEFTSGCYPGKRNFYSEVPKEEILHGSSFSRLSSCSSNPSLPGYKYKSGSSVETSFSLGSNDSYSYRGRPDDFLLRYQKRSYNCDGSLNPLWNSKLDHVSTDIPSPTDWRLGHQENSWELSAPFRSSFCDGGPGSISSSSSRYGPLVDGLLPSKLGDPPFDGNYSPGFSAQRPPSFLSQSFQKSLDTTTSLSGGGPGGILSSSGRYGPLVDSPLPSKVGDPLFNGNYSPGFSAPKPPSFLSQSFDKILDTTTSPRGYSGHTAIAAGHGSSMMDSRDRNTFANKKHQFSVLNHGVTISTLLKNLEGKEKYNDEPKEGKMFRVALVEYLKELIKPSWNNGLISKDAHKIILKRATEKVIGSIQPLHFPSTGESIDQYLSASHSKLKKLVDDYVTVYKSSSQG